MKSIFDNNNPLSNNNNKCCAFCGAPLRREYDFDYCDRCKERILFLEVKEFIRQYDVNEFQVADYFGIPLRVVKGWIKEGRIEYKHTPSGQKVINNNLSCEHCGAPITFGTLCSKCLKLLNKNMQGYGLQTPQGDDRMFFLNNLNNNDSNKK